MLKPINFEQVAQTSHSEMHAQLGQSHTSYTVRSLAVPDVFVGGLAELFFHVCTCDVSAVDWDGHSLILVWFCQDLCGQDVHTFYLPAMT